jgi:capsular polysaccharide transport system permease protein
MTEIEAPGPGSRVARRRAQAPAAPMESETDWRRSPSKIDQFESYRLHKITFVLMVLLPLALAAIYYGIVASDRYAVSFRFGLRQSSVPVVSDDLVSKLMVGMPSANAGREAYMVAGYVRSQNIVDRLDADSWLRGIFSRPGVDWLSRVNPDATRERLWRYWQSMTAVSVDRISGLMLVRVEAFNPQDALELALRVKRDAEAMIDKAAQKSRDDGLRVAGEELEKAGKRYAEALVALRALRESEATVDPEKSIDEAVKTLVAVLREKLGLERDLAASLTMVSANAPQLKGLRDRIAALDAQVKTMSDALAGGSATSRSAASAISRFEEKELERRFSEKLLEIVTDGYAAARIEAERQHLYVTTFVDPQLPESPEFPRRGSNIALVGLLCFIAWCIMLLIVATIKDHKLVA